VSPKKVAIIQSNYIPWKGYFDIINRVDEFILLDDVQYTRRDWRNRNLIKTSNGLQWLTIPVNVKDNYLAKINEVTIADKHWPLEHWTSIRQNYSKAPYFKQYKDQLEEVYRQTTEENLSRVNYRFITAITQLLGIATKISFSTDYGAAEGKNERLVELCKKAGATRYISGPAAKGYLQEEIFNRQQIQVSWMDYSGYKPYQQLYPPFEHGVTILDLIFNEGPAARDFMKSFKLV
jgi:hypothetical protein